MQELITAIIAVGVASVAAGVLIPMLGAAAPDHQDEDDADLRDQLGAAR